MRFWMVALAFAVLFDARVGRAQVQREDDEPRAAPPNSSAPEQHFERALEHYRAGRYRAAVQALNAAIVLDPQSKDLFYNLALLYEKLGQLDLAIVALGRYIELERDPAEVKRAGTTMTRLQGARAELAVPQGPTQASSPPAPIVPRTPAPRPRQGDPGPWILGGTALSAAAAMVGILFGVRALTLANEPDGEEDADQSARIASVALSTGVLAGAGTALLWYMRPREECSGMASGVGLSFQGAF